MDLLQAFKNKRGIKDTVRLPPLSRDAIEQTDTSEVKVTDGVIEAPDVPCEPQSIPEVETPITVVDITEAVDKPQVRARCFIIPSCFLLT